MESCFDKAGQHTVDADAVRAKLFRHSDCLGGYRRLCACVDSRALASAVMAGNRADVDDISFAFFQIRQGGPGCQKGAEDVGGIHVVVISYACGLEGLAVDERAGIVDKYVDAAGLFCELLDHFFDLFFAADIGAEHKAFAVFLYLLEGFFCTDFCFEIMNSDKTALPAE